MPIRSEQAKASASCPDDTTSKKPGHLPLPEEEACYHTPPPYAGMRAKMLISESLDVSGTCNRALPVPPKIRAGGNILGLAMMTELSKKLQEVEVLQSKLNEMGLHMPGLHLNSPAPAVMGKPDMKQTMKINSAKGEVTKAELYETKQRADESALDYIYRWKDLCARCRHPPNHEEAVQICKRNLKTEVLTRLIGIEVKSFDLLNEIVADIEAFLAKYHPAATVLRQKNKPAGEQPMHKDICIADFQAFEKKRERAKEAASSSSAKTGELGHSLRSKMTKPYSFPREKTRVLFEWVTRHGKIILPAPKKPGDAARKNEPRFCPYHQMLGHPIEDCYVFKDVMESLIQKGELQIGEYRVDPPRPHRMLNFKKAADMAAPHPPKSDLL